MALPPIHNLTNPVIYVTPFDSAWLKDGKDKDGDDIFTDPGKQARYKAYSSGSTRYDIEPVKDLIDESAAPVKFVLEKMSYAQFTKMMTIRETRGEREAYNFALQASLKDIVNLEGWDQPSYVTSADLDKLADLVGASVMFFVGLAAQNCAIPLTEQEKKV